MRWPEPGITLTVVIPPARARSKESARGSMASRMRTSGCIGPEPSPPSPSPTWEWVSTMPGMTTLPVTSTVVAPEGTRTEPLAPTATIRSPSITTTPSAMAGPAMGMTVPPTNAVGWARAPEARASRKSSVRMRTGRNGESMREGTRAPEARLACRTPSDAMPDALKKTPSPRHARRARRQDDALRGLGHARPVRGHPGRAPRRARGRRPVRRQPHGRGRRAGPRRDGLRAAPRHERRLAHRGRAGAVHRDVPRLWRRRGRPAGLPHRRGRLDARHQREQHRQGPRAHPRRPRLGRLGLRAGGPLGADRAHRAAGASGVRHPGRRQRRRPGRPPVLPLRDARGRAPSWAARRPSSRTRATPASAASRSTARPRRPLACGTR